MEYITLKNANSYYFLIPDNESKRSYENLVFTLDSIVYLFKKFFPNLDKTDLFIINDKNLKNPMCFKTKKIIFLTCSSDLWCRAAYQFAHELCHYMIPNEVCTNLRWLEESICELASSYFLPQISTLWKMQNNKFKTVNNKPYYPCFTEYINKNSKKATPFDLSQLANSEQTSSILQKLINNCEIRDKNLHIANNLLPIFQKHPETWEAIPLLGDIPSDLSLKDSLQYWYAKSPHKCHTGLNEIGILFGIKSYLDNF